MRMWQHRRWSGRSGRSSTAARSPGLTDRQLLERFIDQPRCRRRSRLRRTGDAGTGRWSWTSAGSSWATSTMPRMPSRPSSSSWPARPARSATPTCWATGCTGSRSARPARPGSGSPAGARDEEGGIMSASGVRRRAVAGRSAGRWPASRPRPCTTRSTACRVRSACRSCSATSRDSRSTRRRGGSAAPPARSAAGWPGPRQAPPRPHPPRRGLARRRPGRGARLPVAPRRPSHPPCATSPPGPRSTSRPDRPPPGPSRPRRRPLPRRC